MILVPDIEHISAGHWLALCIPAPSILVSYQPNCVVEYGPQLKWSRGPTKIPAFIDQRAEKPNYWSHSHHILGWTEKCSLHNVCGRVLPQFPGNRHWLPLHSARIHPLLVYNFNYSVIAVQQTWWRSICMAVSSSREAWIFV